MNTKLLTLCVVFGLATVSTAALAADDVFEAKIRPVLADKCYSCHSSEAGKSKGGLLLDTRAGMRQGGDTGPAVVPGNIKQSLLIHALEWHDPDLRMPPENKGGKLPDAVIADFKNWILAGAADPREGQAVAKKYDGMAAKDWWAYQPMTKPQVPTLSNSTWAKTDIDRFIFAKLQQQGLSPVPPADNATLVRRLYLDLTGLPPSINEVTSVDKLIDTLLNSREFAERWARHWLDVARYAETTGGDVNVTLPEAWRYRDYVIDSFHEDKPYNIFIREQIAGDLLPAKNDKERATYLIATGYLAIGTKSLNGTDPRQFAVDLADEQINAVSQGFLGMTVSCARCHDHKFDPISQQDYTAMAGIFLSTETHFGTPGGVRARNASTLIDAPTGAHLITVNRRMDPQTRQRKNNQYKDLVAQRDAALAARGPGARSSGGQQMTGFDMVRLITETKKVEMEVTAFNEDGSLKPRIMGVLDKPTTAPRTRTRGMGGPNSSRRTTSGFDVIADSPLFVRGSIDNEAASVPRGVPGILSSGQALKITSASSGRLQLAEWIASPKNQLTARVMVNRVWYWLFGRGLVESVDNFGASGSRPSHPELLDYLAQQFIADGWSIKKLIKRIVTSNVYQLDTIYNENNQQIDPDNRLCWRMNTRRLDAETIRDSMLMASGELDRTPIVGSLIALAGDGPIGGDRFHVLKESQIETANHVQRSIYLPIARTVQAETLAVFDFSDPSVVIGARDTTIVPPQALYLMNSQFVRGLAQAMAQRVMQERGFDKRFTLACRLAYGRAPQPAELTAARKIGGDDLTTWTSICCALFCSADFLFY